MIVHTYLTFITQFYMKNEHLKSTTNEQSYQLQDYKLNSDEGLISLNKVQPSLKPVFLCERGIDGMDIETSAN